MQAAALSSRHSFSPDLSMGNLLKLIDQQTMKMCDKVGQLKVRPDCAGPGQASLACSAALKLFHTLQSLQALLCSIAWVCCSCLCASLPLPSSYAQTVGGCGMKNSVVHTLNSLPLVFTLQVGWSSHHEQPHSVAATLAAVDDTVSRCCEVHCAGSQVPFFSWLLHIASQTSTKATLHLPHPRSRSWTWPRCTQGSGAACGTTCCAPCSAAPARSTLPWCAPPTCMHGCW